MQLLRYFVLAYWFFGLAQCVLKPRVAPGPPATGITILQRLNPDQPDKGVWRTIIPVPNEKQSSFVLDDLYAEASKAFNWLRTQPNIMTKGKAPSAVVAAFYDHNTKKIYLSTILRGDFLEKLVNGDQGKATAPLWSRLRGKQKGGDAEDGAFYYREESGPPVKPGHNYGDPTTGKPDGSMIAAWGEKDFKGDISRVSGKRLELCSICKTLAYHMGVLFDGADMNHYVPPTALPKKEAPKTPAPKGSPYKDDTTLDKLSSSDEKKVNQWTQPADPKAPPKTPSPKSSPYNDDKTLDKLSSSDEKKLNQWTQPAKRPATHSPEDAGKHKPKGPTTPSPVAIPHRPTPGRKSPPPKPGDAPKRRSLNRPGRSRRYLTRRRRRYPTRNGRYYPSEGDRRSLRRSSERQRV